MSVRDRAIMRFATANLWMLHAPVMEQLVGVLNRHADAVRLEDDQIRVIVAERDARQDRRMAALSQAGSDDTTAPLQVIGSVGVIPVSGLIVKRADSVNGISQPQGTATGDIVEALGKAQSLRVVKSVALDIDSPGGTVAGNSDVIAAIRRVQAAGKPVIAYAHDQCASGGYRIAAACDKVYGNSMAVVGSVGVCTCLEDSSAIAEKRGLRIHMVASGKAKGGGVYDGAPVTAAHLEEAKSYVDSSAQVFLDEVRQARNLTEQQCAKIADGGVFVGADAVGLGLMDGVEDLQTLIQQMEEDARAEAA